MAQQSSRTGSHLYFFAILVLLSYVLSSAPRYVRQMRDVNAPGAAPSAEVFRQLISVGKAYTIEPYKKVWDGWNPGIGLADLGRLKALVMWNMK